MHPRIHHPKALALNAPRHVTALQVRPQARDSLAPVESILLHPRGERVRTIGGIAKYTGTLTLHLRLWLDARRLGDEVLESATPRKRLTLWMCGRTPPPAMVARMRRSSSSSPRIASWRWRGVMRLTRRSLAALPGVSGVMGRRHTGELEDLGGQVLHNRGDVDCGLGADAHVVCVLVTQEPSQSQYEGGSHASVPVDTTNRELWGGERRDLANARWMEDVPGDQPLRSGW